MNTPVTPGQHVLPRVSARIALAVSAFMLATAVTTEAIRPARIDVSRDGAVRLEEVIPNSIGTWRVDKSGPIQIINPEVKQNLDQIYSDVLSRVYSNEQGERIMLSIAYGARQSDANQVHRPEICYPAQGFTIHSRSESAVELEGKSIPTVRLETRLSQRSEPVTYWIRTGGKITNGSIAKKLVEVEYGLKGLIPDGLVFRVSSIDKDSAAAFRLHHDFVRTLFLEVDSAHRAILFGALQPEVERER